jgi:hypothetical protein
MKDWVTTCVVAVGLSMAAPGVAVADPGDNVQRFLDYLERNGEPAEQSPELERAAVDLGRATCGLFAGGSSADQVMRTSLKDGRWTTHQAAVWMVGSVEYLCPQYDYLLGTYNEIPPPPPPPAPSGPCFYSPATPECPPQGLTPEQRENW